MDGGTSDAIVALLLMMMMFRPISMSDIANDVVMAGQLRCCCSSSDNSVCEPFLLMMIMNKKMKNTSPHAAKSILGTILSDLRMIGKWEIIAYLSSDNAARP